MTADVVNQLRNLSDGELRPIATQVLGDEAVDVDLTSIEKIGESAGQATLGIYRVQGHASTAAGARNWSAVVKAIGASDTPSLVGDFDGRHEPRVYEDGVLANLCGRVRAAHCYAIQRQAETQFLWLEDLSNAKQPPWELEQFVECANHLGQFNAHWPVHSLPTWEWLNHVGMREFFRGRQYQELFAQLPALQADPLAGRALPPAIVQELASLWDASDLLLMKTEDAPKGVCHGNCHASNLFPIHDATGGSYTVAIDWVKIGINAYSEDLGHLVGSAITWHDLSIDEARRGVEPLFDAYVTGLKEAGWSGNEEQMRLTLLTRLSCEAFRSLNLVALISRNSGVREAVASALKQPFEAILDRYPEVFGFYIDCKNQALRLVNRF